MTLTRPQSAYGRIDHGPAWPDPGPTTWATYDAAGRHVATVVDIGQDDPYAQALATLGLSRPYGACVPLQWLRDGWDSGDRWGSAMGAAFAVAEILTLLGEPVPAELDYSAPYGCGYTLGDARADDCADRGVSAEAMSLVMCLDMGAADADDLSTAARILARYLDCLRANGEDY